MELVADLHLHSKYSRAVSQQMVIPEMAKWAKIKGIDLLGTGDFTHPQWLTELKESLEECGQGVFKVKVQSAKIKGQNQKLDLKTDREIKFLLTTEISSIYNQGGKTRKIHNLILAPSFSTIEKINGELRKRGCNLSSDGRPIIGISAKDLVKMVFSVDERCLIIPAHIWTPWFSMFGANSGFDNIEECFGEFSKYICAVETGLSSDPKMNWKIKDLDNRSIVSFSDAHSPANLGREATVFEIEDSKVLRYEDIRKAIMGEGGKWEVGREIRVRSRCTKDSSSISTTDSLLISYPHVSYTIEFYPEEGKYHYTGHRNCKVIFSPEDTAKRGTTCPVCGRALTIGVMERVRKLGSLEELERAELEEVVDSYGVRWVKKKNRPPYARLVSLAEIVAEVLGVGESSKKVEQLYSKLIEKLGSEIYILMKRKLKKIAEVGGVKLAEGIYRARSGDIIIQPGFDGQYGEVRIWPSSVESSKKNEKNFSKEQMSLFG